MRFFNAITPTLILVTAVLAHAQNTNYTLDQAKQLALEKNLSVIQADANVGSAQASVLSAYGGYLPSLSASGGWGRSKTDRSTTSYTQVGGVVIELPATETSTISNWNTGLSANWMLFDGFNRQAQVKGASSRSIATELTAVRTRQSIVFQVESGYLNVLRDDQLVRVSDENLKRDKQQLDRITESNRVGAAALADVYRQQSAVASDEYALISAQNTYDKAKADLVALIGLDAGKEYTFTDPTIITQATPAQLDSIEQMYANLPQLVDRAFASRPDYKGEQETYNAAQAGVTQAKSNYFPSLNASARYTLSGDEFNRLSDNKTLNWGLSLQWTLFDGFNTNAGVQSAVANRRIAEINLAQAERDITTEIKKALLDLSAARKQYEVSQKALVSASEDRKIAEERYNLGAGTLLDLLVANANLVSAQANSVNAVYNYITARRNVEYSIGERTY